MRERAELRITEGTRTKNNAAACNKKYIIIFFKNIIYIFHTSSTPLTSQLPSSPISRNSRGSTQMKSCIKTNALKMSTAASLNASSGLRGSSRGSFPILIYSTSKMAASLKLKPTQQCRARLIDIISHTTTTTYLPHNWGTYHKSCGPESARRL